MAAPTLLVGLGGTGSKIVQRVRLLAKKYHMEQNLSYVVFDTDVNELADIRLRTPEIQVVQTSTKQTVGQYLDEDTYARDNWFPVNQILNRKNLSEGAGQVRAISRLALNTAIKTGKMEPLHTAVEQLYKLNGEASGQALRVILVGSLCGGTGSGLILPISLYIRNYLITRFQQNAAILRGFVLLPEVFYEVIHTQEERNNLKANAYAAIRELDAFLMKGDGSLPSKYSPEFLVPRAGSDMSEEYDVSPMDFCFLYDAQNMDGNKQNSFNDYLDHAASCIYAQSIAPTSKRSNSSEDNVIRDLCKSGGRNRYCGAGSSMIIYPMEDVREYIALTWLRDNVSAEWLRIDEQYTKEQDASKKARRRGLSVPSTSRERHYIDAIDAGADTNRIFEATVRRQCQIMDESGTYPIGNRWDEYLKAVSSYIRKAAIANRSDVTKAADACVTSEEVVSSAAKDKYQHAYSEWYNCLQIYKATAFRAAQDCAKTITYALFKDDDDNTRTDDTFRLEYWLKNDLTGNIAHPNAIRYFLYQLHFKLEQELKKQQTKVRNINSFFDEFENETFDDESTETRKETASDYIEVNLRANKNPLNRGKVNAAKQTLDEQFKLYYENVSSYRTEYVMQECMDAALRYVDDLCTGFEQFYTVLSREISGIENQLEALESRYAYTEGQPTRYVCASQKCMRAMSETMKYNGDSMELPAALTAMLFNRAKSYALMDKKPPEEFFKSIYDDGTDGSQLDDDGDPVINSIMSFWRYQVMAERRSDVDLDAIDAMKREFELEHEDETYDRNAWKIYASKIISQANVLSRPFIESPLGIEPRTIPAACYSTELTENVTTERRTFVDANLGNNGGVADPSIDKHIIVLYQAIYGLRANDLSKFAPPKKAETYNRVGGEYYNAYYELVSQLNPRTTESRAITPHIDKRWHNINVLPDLDEESERSQEYNIQAAMFWGLMTGTIDFVENRGRQKYALRVDHKSDSMVVSNGTECDLLYEVLDSLIISPLNVKRILERRDHLIQKERDEKRPIGNSLLRRKLDGFKIPEFPRPAGTEQTRTIFDIAMLMKKSKPVDEYDVDEICRLMETIFSEIRSYIGYYLTEEAFDEYYGRLLYNQMKQFLLHTAEEYQISKVQLEEQAAAARAANERVSEEEPEWLNICNDDLFRSLVQMTTEELEECWMDQEADELKKVSEDLNRA